MPMVDEAPFERGTTYYGAEAIDTANLGGLNLEGKEYIFEDVDPRSTAGSLTIRTNRPVRARIVRNMSGVALLPSRCVKGDTTNAGVHTTRVLGYSTLTADDRLGIVDEYLPPAGVRNGDLFYCVVSGPTNCLTDIAASANNVLPLGTRVVALTAVTSQSTTAGRIAPQDLTGATAVLGNAVQNVIGRVLTARTTSNTNTPTLVDIGNW